MSTALDVGIGLILLYLLLALLVTTVQELVASVLGLRAKHLYQAIDGMLKGDASSSPLAKQLYEHPLIQNLAKNELKLVAGKLPTFGDGLPSYIPSKTFALALLDILKGDPASKATGADRALVSARALVGRLTEPKLKQSLDLLIDEAQRLEQDIDKQAAAFSEHIEAWFNDRMARASGWYKRDAQIISLCLGIGLSVACNASTFKVVERLWHDANLRAAVVASAQAHLDTGAGSLATSHLPVGWHGYSAVGWDFVLIPLGWLVTGLAVSLGSAFWFDVLSKALQLRSTGTKVSAVDGKVQSKGD